MELADTTSVLLSALAQAAEPAAGIHPLVTTLIFIGMLVVLVFFHELGHFLTALWMGIQVEEFGIGFPPRAATLFEHNGVKYTLNWLPLGGFVRFGGEDNAAYASGSLSEAPPARKIPVMLAGPLMNVFVTLVIFIVLFAVMGQPIQVGQTVDTVFEESPAAAAGVQPGDTLLTMNGQPLNSSEAVTGIAMDHPGETIPLTLRRDGEEMTLEITPGPWTSPSGESRDVGLGIGYRPEVENQPVNPLMAIVVGFAHTGELVVLMLNGLGQMIGGLFGVNEPPPGGVTGPVGIARATGEVIDAGGLPAFWNWMAIISLNLAVLNLLPIPPLDGSHITLSLIEWLRGKRVPPEKEAMVHAIGFATLMGLIVLVSAIDVMNAIQGTPVLGQ
jgi:regulator of sigma E protease